MLAWLLPAPNLHARINTMTTCAAPPRGVVGQGPYTVKLVMFACSKYCVFFIFSFMRVLINATPPDVRYLKQKGQIYACFNDCVLMHSH